MKVASVAKAVERYIIDNSPTILTAFGVTGAVTTTYLSIKATFRASDVLTREKARREMSEIEEDLILTNKDKAKLVWKEYIPPAIALATTVSCIIGANTINTKRMAALAAAYALTEKNHAAYKDKVRETLGLKKDDEIREAVAQDMVRQTPVGNVERARGGDVMFLDAWTGRYFTSDMQTVRAAENEMNKAMYKGGEGVISVADFYDNLGLSVPKCAEEVGWDRDHDLELRFYAVEKNDSAVMVVDFVNTPVPLSGVFR